MGSLCTACYYQKHRKLWRQSVDDSPCLCVRHSHIKNDADWDRYFGLGSERPVMITTPEKDGAPQAWDENDFDLVMATGSEKSRSDLLLEQNAALKSQLAAATKELGELLLRSGGKGVSQVYGLANCDSCKKLDPDYLLLGEVPYCEDCFKKLPANIEQLRKNVEHWMKESFEWHKRSMAERAELSKTQAALDVMREGLKFYAEKDAWAEFVSGGNIFGECQGDHMMAFDKGDDTPWASANEALARADHTLKDGRV